MLSLSDITLHSRRQSFFKIECDDLTEEDWQAAARMLYEVLPPFGMAYGIPRGGVRLANILQTYVQVDSPALIVDDVLTTGGSMATAREQLGHNAIGAVVFARGACPDWITPLFQLHSGLWSK